MANRYYAIAIDLIESGSFELKVGPGNPRCVAGNDLIGFEREHDNVYFLGTSRVKSVEEKEFGGIRLYVVKVDVLADFSKPRRLSVLAGSLEKVYRFLEPERHFRRRIVGLSKDDYQTIVEERVDLNRSIFRYLFSALPLELQTEFIRMHSDILPLKSEAKIRDFSALASAIVSFFNSRLRETLELMGHLRSTYDKLGVKGIPPLKKLFLASGNLEDMVAFGEVVIDMDDLLRTNSLYAPRTSNITLLEKCMKLVEQEDIKSMRWKRRWNETIF